MESAGIAVLMPMLTELQSQFGDQIDAAEAAYGVIGKQINLGSPSFSCRSCCSANWAAQPNAPRPATTDADALQSLFDKTGHPFLQHLLAHRDVTRLKGHRRRVAQAVAADGPHPHHTSQTIAATGRLSSTEPASAGTPTGRRIQGCVRGQQLRQLMTTDYSGRSRCGSWRTCPGTRASSRRSNTGEDLHSFVASRAFGVPIDEVTGELRRRSQGDVLRAGLRVEAPTAIAR